jgi:hypothetical protein
MPFDGIGFAFDDRVRKMDQVINLLATPEKWCKAQFKTPDGRYCIRGAMRAVEGAEFLKPIVLRAIREVTGKRYLRIEAFNDYPYTQHTEVQRVLARARHLVASGQSAAEAAPATEAGGWSTLWKALLTSISRKRAPARGLLPGA